MAVILTGLVLGVRCLECGGPVISELQGDTLRPRIILKCFQCSREVKRTGLPKITREKRERILVKTHHFYDTYACNGYGKLLGGNGGDAAHEPWGNSSIIPGAIDGKTNKLIRLGRK